MVWMLCAVVIMPVIADQDGVTGDEARVPSSDDPREVFNLGCRQAETGEMDEARELFRAAALAKNPAVAKAAYFNLGALHARAANRIAGNQPETLDEDQRQQVLFELDQAVDNYRQCLELDANDQVARRHLESLQHWIREMQNRWREEDRQRRRDESGVLEFLDFVWRAERQQHETSRGLAAQHDSPKRRWDLRKLRKQLTETAAEIPFLKQKIFDEVLADSGGDGPDDQVREVFEQLLSGVRQQTEQANDQLAREAWSRADATQSEAIDGLDRIYRALAPFDEILQRSVQTQEELARDSSRRGQGSRRADATEAGGSAGASPAADLAAEDQTAADQTSEDKASAVRPDQRLAFEDQQRVADWAVVLGLKAEQLQSNAEATANTDPTGSPTPPPSKTRREAWQKAIELTPQIRQLALAAARDLKQARWPEALPKQEEALKLLHEIQQKLPPPPQEDQQQQQQQDQQQDQGQQDQGQQDQQEDQTANEDGESPTPNEQKNEQQPGEGAQEKGSDVRLSSEDAEAMLRQMLEREREYRQQRLRWEHILRGSTHVEKDW